ncbi:hypothetical protein A9Q81_01205 [Gammaproteobacteria bacterium 42_54_T18]|nr:hypothetical protein A9Q81_01205 [Gammaproteobacteria bacterium 42_54_T18]
MLKYLRVPALAVAMFGLSGCNHSTVYPLFDVEANVVPVPNDLMFAAESTGDGTLYAGSDPSNPVVTGLDFMDGASVIAQIDIPFSGSLDVNQLLSADTFISVEGEVIPNPYQNVFLLPLVFPGGDSVVTASLNEESGNRSIEQAGFLDQWMYEGATRNGDVALLDQLVEKHSVRVEIISLNGEQDNVLRLSPLTPLVAETKYLLVVTKSLVGKDGVEIGESPNYALLSDNGSEVIPGSASSQVRPAVIQWEHLAQQYFSFMNSSYKKSDVDFVAPEGIALAYSFTTGGTSTVMESMASPALYFENQITVKTKQDAIKKMAIGSYNLSGILAGGAGNNVATNNSPDYDIQVNALLHKMLTCESILVDGCNDDGINHTYYRGFLAERIAAGEDEFADYVEEPETVHLLQRAVADAAVTIKNTNENSVKHQAALMVGALEGQLPTPESQASLFYRKDCLGSSATGCNDPINPFFPAPAYVAQGQITLPYYLQTPIRAEDEVNPNPIALGSWVADTELQENLHAPASDMVTYRFPFPKQQASLRVPIVAVYPNEAVLSVSGQSKPEAGWPVIIYQHGITTSRSMVLPMGDAFAFSCVDSRDPTLSTPTGAPCFATVAIDQALHGIDTDGSFMMRSVNDPDAPIEPNMGGNIPSADLMERHFNFTANEVGMPIPMDYVADTGSSGSLFTSLFRFATSRDNLRQTTIDLMNVSASLGDMDIDGDGIIPDLDINRVYFVAHSLGGINGAPFLAVNSELTAKNAVTSMPAIKAAALLNVGGGVAKLLENSPDKGFGADVVIPVLASVGLTQGTSAFETYMSVFQAVTDSADAMNYGAILRKNENMGLLLTEIIGGGDDMVPDLDNPFQQVMAQVESDQTVGNDADINAWPVTNIGPYATVLENGFVISALPAPLTGTEPLAAELGAIKTKETIINGKPVVAITRFTKGSHGTPVTAGLQQANGRIIDRFSSSDVFIEMLSEMVLLFASDGLAIDVSDSTVVED